MNIARLLNPADAHNSDLSATPNITTSTASCGVVLPPLLQQHACTWSECSRTFTRRADMLRHLRIHTNDRPYKCTWPDCDRSFVQRSGCTVHWLTHTGEKPYACDWEGCGRVFGDSSSLTRHKRVHTGAKPYVCAVCRRAFTRSGSLRHHMTTAGHGAEPGGELAAASSSPGLSPVASPPNSSSSRHGGGDPPSLYLHQPVDVSVSSNLLRLSSRPSIDSIETVLSRSSTTTGGWESPMSFASDIPRHLASSSDSHGGLVRTTSLVELRQTQSRSRSLNRGASRSPPLLPHFSSSSRLNPTGAASAAGASTSTNGGSPYWHWRPRGGSSPHPMPLPSSMAAASANASTPPPLPSVLESTHYMDEEEQQRGVDELRRVRSAEEIADRVRLAEQESAAVLVLTAMAEEARSGCDNSGDEEEVRQQRRTLRLPLWRHTPR